MLLVVGLEGRGKTEVVVHLLGVHDRPGVGVDGDQREGVGQGVRRVGEGLHVAQVQPRALVDGRDGRRLQDVVALLAGELHFARTVVGVNEEELADGGGLPGGGVAAAEAEPVDSLRARVEVCLLYTSPSPRD